MKKNYKYILIILLVTILIMSHMFNDVYYIGHDTKYHLSVIIDLVNRIHANNIIPSKISSIVGYGFGYGTSLFYPPFAHIVTAYIAKAIGFLTKNPYYSMKIMHFICMFLSGVVMYFLSLKLFKNKKVALTSSVIYMFFPYRLSDIYIRDAFAESWIFVFLPIILLGLFELLDKNYFKFFIFFTSGYVLGMYSHLVSMVYFTILLIPFFIVYFKQIFTKKNILYLLMSSLLILCLTSPFITTLLEHKINGSYKVFSEGIMASGASLNFSSINLLDYFSQTPNTKYEGILTFINIFIMLLFVISLITYKKLKFTKEQNKIVLSIFLILLFTIIIMSPLIDWKKLPDFTYMIQFLWRLEIMVAICISLIAPLCIKIVSEKNQKIFTTIIIIGVILFGWSNIKFNSNEIINYETSNVKDWGMGWQKEYLPVKCSFEYLIEREQNPGILIVDGNAKIKIEEDAVPYLKFSIENIDKNVTIELPRIYYLGYQLTDSKNNKIKIKESDNGFLQVTLNKNDTYKLDYVGTKAYKISVIVCITTVCSIIILLVYYNKKIGIKK